MPKGKQRNDWIKGKIEHIESNWDRYENRIQYTFTIALFVLPFAFNYAIKTGWDMLGLLASVTLWTVVICGWFLIRNTGKTTKHKLDNIETQLIKSNKKLDKLIRILSIKKAG
ncbi:MAG: hypothetical protein WC231_01830 [Dehalococcoidales bacterium]|nr:hypothetical protein [Dehalococcoidales bacterium]